MRHRRIHELGDLDNIREFPRNVEDSAPNGLTGIPLPIHCPATQTSGRSEYDELDCIQIDNFLDTLADVALAIAAREQAETKNQDRSG